MTDDEPMQLPMMLSALGVLGLALVNAAEQLDEHRRATDDDTTRVELHAIASDLDQAWAHLERATTALRDLLAVGQ
jgi:hypothetical protein